LRNIKDYVGRLKANKTPLVLTVNGRAERVGQDAESYQLILERLERVETLASIRRGREQFDRGEGIPLLEEEERLRKNMAFRVEISPQYISRYTARHKPFTCFTSGIGQ
jgi:hypothetical protein